MAESLLDELEPDLDAGGCVEYDSVATAVEELAESLRHWADHGTDTKSASRVLREVAARLDGKP